MERWKRRITKTGNRRTNVLGSMDNKEERQRRKSGTHSMGDGGRFIEEGEGGSLSWADKCAYILPLRQWLGECPGVIKELTLRGVQQLLSAGVFLHIINYQLVIKGGGGNIVPVSPLY